MRLVLALLIGSAACAQSPDATAIIRESVHRDLINFERLKNYTYNERFEARSYDKGGKLKKTEVETFEILILNGGDYARLIARDDKPLPANEARKQQEKLDKEIEKRRAESAAEKARRDKDRQEQRKFLNELPDAFTFKLAGEEAVSGEPAWVIIAEPKPGYQPKDRLAKVLSKMRGKIWVDKSEYQWVKIDAEAIDTLSFGLKMVQIQPGATIHFEQTRVNDEVWLPAAAKIYANARLILFKQLHSEVDITFRDYKKFQADSRLVSADH